MYPATPRDKQTPVERWGGQIAVYSFEAMHGATNCMVAVSEYPRESLGTVSEKERFESARDWIAARTGGKVLREAEVEQGGLKGREYEIEVENMGVIRSRHFWVGQRLYQVQERGHQVGIRQVIYPVQDVSPPLQIHFKPRCTN